MQDVADHHYEAIVLGAGFGGLRMLHELRQIGLSVRVLEAASDVGGTWYWNRYPGARTDSESWAYMLWFDEELLQEWDWSERFPRQPEVLRYLQHVVDRHDMRRDIQFDTRVTSAVRDEPANRWTITTEGGEQWTCTYLVTALGVLSVPQEPSFEGIDEFTGEAYLTARWPHEPVDFAGKRIGIVGTGATAVQVLPVVAQTAGHVSVFQRTPNYVMPARNHPLDDHQRQAIKADYTRLLELMREQVWAFPIEPAGRKAADTVPAEQQRILEAGWESGGFRFVFETFDDLVSDDASNQVAAEFVRNKIRAIVHDPETAELLCPTDHPIISKRPPLGHFYYEAFNRDNVTLVDVRAAAIERVTPRGIRLADGTEHEVDMIIYALGFDALTGAMLSFDVRGREGQTLAQRWEAGPRTHLGIQVNGFPNLFMVCGPQSPFANLPVVMEEMVSWIGRAIRHMREHGYDRMEPEPEAVDRWARHMEDLISRTVLPQAENARSWFLGANIPGKPHAVLGYFGGAGRYFHEIEEVADHDFEGFALTRAATPTPAPV